MRAARRATHHHARRTKVVEYSAVSAALRGGKEHALNGAQSARSVIDTRAGFARWR